MSVIGLRLIEFWKLWLSCVMQTSFDISLTVAELCCLLIMTGHNSVLSVITCWDYLHVPTAVNCVCVFFCLQLGHSAFRFCFTETDA